MGSSGNSTRPPLHYTARFHGAQIESGMYPATYWANPLPYAGDVPIFAFDAFYSNYVPGADSKERISPIGSFGTGEAGGTNLFFIIETYDFKATDTVTWKWYQPDGALAYSTSYSPAPNSWRFSLDGRVQPLSAFQSIPGTWQVAWEINGVEYKRLPIIINATG